MPFPNDHKYTAEQEPNTVKSDAENEELKKNGFC